MRILVLPVAKQQRNYISILKQNCHQYNHDSHCSHNNIDIISLCGIINKDVCVAWTESKEASWINHPRLCPDLQLATGCGNTEPGSPSPAGLPEQSSREWRSCQDPSLDATSSLPSSLQGTTGSQPRPKDKRMCQRTQNNGLMDY